MASQQNDPLTFTSWGENCTSLWGLLANESITQDQFLSSCKPQVDIGVGKIILTVILSILLLGTAGGNVLVIVAILIVKKLRSPTNLLIVNLAVTDFLVSILVLPFAIAYQIFEYWPFKQAICDLYSISDVLLCTLSILSLCTISIDRYMAITKPFQYALKRTPKRMFIMILISWLLSAAISVSPIFGWERQNTPFFCNYNMDLTFQIYATLTAFYIPLTLMLVLYGKVLVLAKQIALVDAQVARKGSIDTQMRDSSIPEGTDCNRSSLYPPGDNCTNSQFFNDLKDNWDSTAGDAKSRQSVVSFKPSPVILRTNREPIKRRKVYSMTVFTGRSQSEILNNGRSSEYGRIIGVRSMSSYGKSPITLLRRGKRRSPSDQGKGETHKAVTTLGVIMGCDFEMRALIFSLFCIFLVVSLSDARAIKRRSIKNEENESEDEELSEKKYDTSVEITPGQATFTNEDKEFDTETKFYPPNGESKHQAQQPVMCCIPGYAISGYQFPYPYPCPLPQEYPNPGKRK
ncbi:hypothetical protein ACTXT7_009230 [Hymenolepis weldensis]